MDIKIDLFILFNILLLAYNKKNFNFFNFLGFKIWIIKIFNFIILLIYFMIVIEL